MDLSKEDMDKRHALPYPMELGAPKFAPALVEDKKDVLLNMGRLHAQQEYDRIMEQVEVLKRQADALTNRLVISEMMRHCVYGILVKHGQTYYVYHNSHKDENWLSICHPEKWCAGPGEHNKFVAAVKLMGDSTWEEVILTANTDIVDVD